MATTATTTTLGGCDTSVDEDGDGGGDGAIDITDAVDGLFRFGDPIEHAGFDLHQNVVAGDGILTGGGQLALKN